MIEFIAVLVAVLVSVFYFGASSTSYSRARRMFVSAHGVAGALLFLLAMIIGGSGHGSVSWKVPFILCWFIPFALIIASLVFFKGDSKVHALQFVNVIAQLYLLFVGLMVITGAYL